MVAVEGKVAIYELEVGVWVWKAKLYYFFVLQEREFLQCFLEMLHFSKHLSEILIIVKIEFGIKRMLGFKSF